MQAMQPRQRSTWAAAAAANSPLVASAVEVHRADGGPVSLGVLLEGSAEGVAVRAGRMAALLSSAVSSASPVAPAWWAGVPDPGDGTLLRVTFWVSALAPVLEAIAAAARETGTSPVVHGSAGAGLLYLTFSGQADAGQVTRLAGIVAAAIPDGRGSVVVVSGPGRSASAIPGAGLMQAVKDQFDPDGRLKPGRIFG